MKFFNWLRRIDGRLFSPPHTFETVLSYVGLRLGVLNEAEADPQRDDGADDAKRDSPADAAK